MLLTLATPPRRYTRVWVQSGNALPEYDAPGFDESCKYIEYEPSQDFIIMIHSPPVATIDDYIAFFVEINGEALSYIFISGPEGFKKNTLSFSLRGDYVEGVGTKKHFKNFKFPPRDSLGQILVKVFKMRVLQNVSTSRLGIDVFKRNGEIRNVPSYQKVRNSEVLTAAHLQESQVFVKPIGEEPLAVSRFKYRTARQLQQLLPPILTLDSLLDLAAEAEIGPQPPSDKVKPASAVLNSHTTSLNPPKPRQISRIIPPSRQVPLQPYENPLAPPSVPSFGSINNPPLATGPLLFRQNINLAQRVGQSLVSVFNNTQSDLLKPTQQVIDVPSPAERQLPTPSENKKPGLPFENNVRPNLIPSPAQAGGIKLPLVQLLESIGTYTSTKEEMLAALETCKARRSPSTRQRPMSNAQAIDSTTPLAPSSVSMAAFVSPVGQCLAWLEDYKPSRSSSALQGPVFSVHAGLGQLGRKLHRTLPCAGTWGAVTEAPPLATFHDMTPKHGAEHERLKGAAPTNGMKRQREEHENNENVILRERPVKRHFRSTE